MFLVPSLRRFVRSQVVKGRVPHGYSMLHFHILGIDWSEFRSATHEDAVCPRSHQRRRTLGRTGNDDLETAGWPNAGGYISKNPHQEIRGVDLATARNQEQENGGARIDFRRHSLKVIRVGVTDHRAVTHIGEEFAAGSPLDLTDPATPSPERHGARDQRWTPFRRSERKSVRRSGRIGTGICGRRYGTRLTHRAGSTRSRWRPRQSWPRRLVHAAGSSGRSGDRRDSPHWVRE